MKLAAGALTLSLASLAVAYVALWTARQKRPDEALPARSEERLPAGGSVPDKGPQPGSDPAPRVEIPQGGSAELRSLEERVSRMEERFAGLEKKWNAFRYGNEEGPVDKVALEGTILDRLKPPAARVSALKKLRWHAPEARTLEVVRSMLDLLRTCEDGAVRAEICRQIADVEYPEVAPEMVNRLRSDSDEQTREEAAESLQYFIDEPGVLQALEYARENDASEDVRLQAVDSIAKAKARRDR